MAAGDRYIRAGHWPDQGFQPGLWDGIELSGKTLGLVGLGRIGRAVAERAAGFGLSVRIHSRSATDDPRYRPLESLLAESDFVCLHVPLTPETRGLIDARALERMKPEAVLVNLARGPVVDEAALVDALERGAIAAAGLDVFEREPHVHPRLRALDNAVLTPHLGGGTRESRRRARLSCASDVARGEGRGAAVRPRVRPSHPTKGPAGEGASGSPQTSVFAAP